MAKSLEAGKIKPMGSESIMMKLDNEKETNVEES
jgi:hypothetical protein